MSIRNIPPVAALKRDGMKNVGAPSGVLPRRIVSGGQTGVDRAALDAALQAGIEVGGWCPKHRRAVDGRIDERYPLQETPLEEYSQRTTWNVRDSDGTLVLIDGEPWGGTAFTIEEARRLGRPILVISPEKGDEELVRRWIAKHDIATLNVAGPRDDAEGSVYSAAYAFMRRLLMASGG